MKIKRFIKDIGETLTKNALDQACSVGRTRLSNLAMYGKDYEGTLENKRLELAERFYILKFELFRAIFGL